MARTLLVTGFGSFPGVSANPSEAVIRRLAETPPQLPEGMRSAFAVLPVTWTMLEETLPELCERHAPAAVLHFGVASKRRMICVEARARNRASIDRPDASGQHRLDPMLDRNGPAARPSTLSSARLIAAIRASGVAARRSDDAGDYLCNATLWRSLIAGFPASFIHLPNADTPGGPDVADLERAARAAITAVAEGIGAKEGGLTR
ncbi:peptidase C15 [Breoghania sp.]|uniref:pyroglutamyl-peptidase I family protein n=1 Tax=Breoghania sp. TaxID=2065378 RepID=UPI002AAA9311|nr:peptidase C15 [Breoghania sp.]